jgi:hypothetical protein
MKSLKSRNTFKYQLFMMMMMIMMIAMINIFLILGFRGGQ